jgi:hypothetical protein
VPEGRAVRKALLFSLGLLVLIPVCLILWGYVLPYYAQILGHAAAPAMRLMGTPVESVDVKADGLFNTGTMLRFNIGRHHPALNVGALVFNVPPFVALMLLTPGLRWRRRLKALGIGVLVLCAGHLLYLLMAFAFSSRIAHSPEIPTALGELFLTLPFLLWIVLGYWERLAAFLAPPAAPRPDAPNPE